MSRPKNAVPSYTLHKPTGQARCRIDGKDFYLGPHNSTESRKEYARVIALHAGGLSPAADEPAPVNQSLSVAGLILAFWRYAEGYYVKNGRPTDELACYKSALHRLKVLYGMTPATEFGPLALKAVRDSMIDEGWTRCYVNKSVHRIRRVFRWAASNQMIGVGVLQALLTVEPLLEGRTEAHDNAPRHAIPQADIDKVRAVVRQRTKDLIDLLLATGARPGEILSLTTGMIDRSGDIWKAELRNHKMAHKGKSRRLYFNIAAQEILKRYFKADQAERLFPINRTSFGHTIGNACIRAKVKRWTPHWLRHTVAQRIRDVHGIEDAQALLGHARPDMTHEYSAETETRVLAMLKKIG